MKIIARILQLIESEGINKNQFYIRTGISNGLLDKANKLGSDNIEKIYSSFPRINLEWLLVGVGEMYKPLEENTSTVADPPETYRIISPEEKLLYQQQSLIDQQNQLMAQIRLELEKQAAINSFLAQLLPLMDSEIARLKNPNEAPGENLKLKKKLKELGMLS